MRDTLEAMIKKLDLFSVCINKDNTQVFLSLYDFCVQMNSNLLIEIATNGSVKTEFNQKPLLVGTTATDNTNVIILLSG